MRGAECEPVAIFFRSVPQTPQVCTRKQQLSSADLWNRNSFQADIIYSAINRRQHGCRDGVRLVVDCELSGNCHQFLMVL